MQAQLFDRYRELLVKLMDDNAEIADSYILETQRQWQTPDENDWNGDPHNISGGTSLMSAFDRAAINTAYTNALNTGGAANGGRSTDTKVCKIQGDYIAADERATSLRYASPIRCAMMASARRSGHGNQATGVFATLINNVVDNLAKGYQ